MICLSSSAAPLVPGIVTCEESDERAGMRGEREESLSPNPFRCCLFVLRSQGSTVAIPIPPMRINMSCAVSLASR